MTNAAGLSDADLSILGYYAQQENRELYWNYLAQLPGNDGYGRLALGVVRNDNMPGATANAYAAAYARDHDGKVLTERDWDQFGVDLIKRDFQSRVQHMDDGRADRALNLPARDVQAAHDGAFKKIQVDPNAWTPRKLLEASRAHGEPEAERVWTKMLNNDAMGMYRGKDTLIQLATQEGMPVAERLEYAHDMGQAYATAINQRPNDNPNVIGTSDHYYMRDHQGDWAELHHASPTIGVQLNQMRDVNDVGLRERLEDTHRLRMERGEARKAFHPNDPGQLVSSPHPLAEVRPRSSLPKAGEDPLYAAIRRQLPFDVPDDKVAEVALQARHAGIREPRQMERIGIYDDTIICQRINAGPCAEVTLSSPAPPMEESLAQAQQLDQQAMEGQMQQQQMAMQQSGPVMSM